MGNTWNRKWSDAVMEQIKRWRASGRSWQWIGSKFNRSPKTCSSAYDYWKNKTRLKKNQWKPEEDRLLKIYIDDGFGLDELTAKINRTHEACRCRAKRLKMRIGRPLKESTIDRRAHILDIIYRLGPISVSEIANITQYPYTTVRRDIAYMLSCELIKGAPRKKYIAVKDNETCA